MSRRVRLVGVMLLSLLLAGYFPSPARGENKESYATLLARVKKFDPSVDFKALRLAYTETPDYNPYARDDETRNAMFEALGNKQYEKALEYAQTMLEKNYVDIDAHLICRICYKETNLLPQYTYHRFVFNGLVNSILDSGDGKSPQTAYLVINIHEEYVIFNYLGFKLKKQSLVTADGHRYDKMEVTPRETGENSVIYFNVDLPLAWLKKSLK